MLDLKDIGNTENAKNNRVAEIMDGVEKYYDINYTKNTME